MANVLVENSSLTAIADAIREKLDTEDTYKPSEMANAIESIGGGITPTGTINIKENGTHDVTNYASANVAVPQGTTPTGTKQISITENGTTTEDVTNYANAEITVNVPTGGGGSNVSYTRYTLTGDTNIRNFIDSAQYQIKNPNALAICIMIRVSGTVAPSGGSYTLNNFVALFGGTTRLYAQHRYQSGAKTPDSFPSLPSVNENNTSLGITNGILTSTASATGTSCIGAAGDVVTIAEMPIPIDNTIMEGGTI